MACCALKKQKKQLLIFPVFLLTVTFIFSVIVITPLLIAGVFIHEVREKRDRSFKLFMELIKGLINRILNEPFLFESTIRCKISGKMMKLSNRMAGVVYKYFNLILLSFLFFVFYFIFQGFRTLLV